MAKRTVRRQRVLERTMTQKEFYAALRLHENKLFSGALGTYGKVIFLPVVEQCKGCLRVVDGYCPVYTNPPAKWATGKCNFARFPEEPVQPGVAKKRVNPLKASKISRRGMCYTGRKVSTHFIKNAKGKTGRKRYLSTFGEGGKSV